MYNLKPVKGLFIVQYNDERNLFPTYEKAFDFAKKAYSREVEQKLMSKDLMKVKPNYFINQQDAENMLSSLISVPMSA